MATIPLLTTELTTLSPTTTTSTMPIQATKLYRFCSISFAGIVCKVTVINTNSEDEDEDEDETENLSVTVPPYLRENIEKYSVIIKGLIENYQNGFDY